MDNYKDEDKDEDEDKDDDKHDAQVFFTRCRVGVFVKVSLHTCMACGASAYLELIGVEYWRVTLRFLS